MSTFRHTRRLGSEDLPSARTVLQTAASFVAGWRTVLLVAAGTVLLAGCASSGGGGSDSYDVDQSDIAAQVLSGVREVRHHPDSLVHLTLSEKDGKIEFELEGSYRERILEWTAAERSSTRRYFRTHATLWSKELSLASLIPERGVETLSAELAGQTIRQRMAEYDSTVQIDVNLFAGASNLRDLGALRLDTAGKRVYLRDEEGRNYAPLRIESSTALEAYRGGRRTLYVRNGVYFDRYAEDGTDLFDTEELRLYVRPYNFLFTWELPQGE